MTGAELRVWREARGLSLDQLAALLDVNRQTLWRWEAGKHAIPGMVSLALYAIERGGVKR